MKSCRSILPSLALIKDAASRRSFIDPLRKARHCIAGLSVHGAWDGFLTPALFAGSAMPGSHAYDFAGPASKRKRLPRLAALEAFLHYEFAA